jgi:two-component sensor histidine kinase/CHASE3 domain sensor protein
MIGVPAASLQSSLTPAICVVSGPAYILFSHVTADASTTSLAAAPAPPKSRAPVAISLEMVVIGSFSLMLLVVGFIGWQSVRNASRMKNAIAWVDQIHAVTLLLSEIELDVREGESALHAYVLTGDLAQRDEYRKQAFAEASSELDAHVRELRRLSEGVPERQLKLGQIEKLLQQRVTAMEALRNAYEKTPSDTALQQSLSLSGLALTMQLVSRFDEFVAQENRLLAARVAEREADTRLVIATITGSGVLGFGCVAVALFVILRGLERRRAAEALLQVSLGEKEILLKEVHHRVKNNLQVVSGLLSLEAEKLRDPQAVAVFRECRDRIHSMARLHQRLYVKGNFASVEFGEHLREMCEMLVRAHTPADCDLSLEVAAETAVLDLDRAVTLGLIANELLLNSLKHAFAGRPAGALSVSLRDGASVELTVRDDGCGLPPGFDPKKSAGLGLELVLGLSRQLHGEATIENLPAGGAVAVIRFPGADAQKNPSAATPSPS